MYVDDTTIYAMASNPDLVVTALNKVLSKLHVHVWCCHNLLTPHPGNPDLVVTALNKVLSKLHVLSGVVIIS